MPNNGLKPLGMTLHKKVEGLERKVKARTEQKHVQDKNKSVNKLKSTPNLRYPPKGDEQPDFFVPSIYDLGIRDNRSLMDVATFGLSKSKKRAGEVIQYKISPHEYVEVKSGPDGMASVWDYDIVLMMVSHLTESMNRYRDGKRGKPGRLFTPHVSDILKFCRKGDGSRQYTEVEAALDRLKGTTIKSVRKVSLRGRPTMREVESEGLIGRYSVMSRTDTGKIASVEIEIPYWIYREVTDCNKPNVLTVHPDYFLIKPGIGRFIYRFARSTAGKTNSCWGFRTLYERSGSTGTFKQFCYILRKLIAADDLPEYTLQEVLGKKRQPMLKMQRRDKE